MGRTHFYFSMCLAIILMIPVASQARYGFYPTFSSMRRLTTFEPSVATAGKVLYYGGPVISNVKVYAVFWGSHVDQETQKGIGQFYATVTNSTYFDWLDEYSTFKTAVDGRKGTSQHIGRGHYAGAVTIQPSNTKTTLDDTEIQTEMQKQIDSGKLPKPDANTLYMIYFPPNVNITAAGLTSCQDFCAYHGFKGSPSTAHFYYGVMPDIGGACYFGCASAPTAFDSLSSISSHELLEAVSDPFPTPGSNPAYPQAWNDDQGNEIGDLCVGGDGTIAAQGSTYYVQSIWDNSKNSCTTNNWNSP